MSETSLGVSAPNRHRSSASRVVASVMAMCVAGVAGIAAATSINAAPGNAASVFTSGHVSGTSVLLEGRQTTVSTKYYNLSNITSTTTDRTNTVGYSLDINGTGPQTTSTAAYTEAQWPTGITAQAEANRGALEWLLKNSYPQIDELEVRNRLGLTGNVDKSDLIGATQAAIWHFTNGVNLDIQRKPDVVSIEVVSSHTGAGNSQIDDLLTIDGQSGWVAQENGDVVFEFRTQVPVQPYSLQFSSLEGATAQQAPRVIKLESGRANGTWASLSSRTLTNAGSGDNNLFTGGASQTKTWVGTGWANYSASDHYRLTITPADADTPLALGGIRVNTTAANEYNQSKLIVEAYKYLVTNAADKAATPDVTPTVSILGRANSALVGNELIGPYEVDGTARITLSLEGSQRTTTQIVNAQGQTLTGSLEPGTLFYLKDNRSSVDDGAVTIVVGSESVTAQTFVARTGLQGGAERVSLSALRTWTQSAAPVRLSVAWTVDQSSSGSSEVESAATERVFNYRYPRTQSATEQVVIWSDYSATVTDLFGLSGSGEGNAYSIDFSKYARLQDRAYQEVAWAQGNNTAARGAEAEILWILRNSYPNVNTNTLSDTLRSWDPNFGSANIKTWEAIAATQAAIWHYSDGKELNTLRLNVPTTARANSTASGDAQTLVGRAPQGAWQASSATATIEFEFPRPTQLSSYSLLSAAGAASAPSAWHLEASSTGAPGTWNHVSSSAVTLTGSSQFSGVAGQEKQKNLGGSATYGSGNGYRYYRLVIDATAGGSPATLTGVTFRTPLGTVNEPRLLALYEYLVEKTSNLPAQYIPTDATLRINGPTVARVQEGDLIGPFTTVGSRSAVTLDDAAERGIQVVDATGAPITTDVVGGQEFYLTSGELVGDELYEGASISVDIDALGVVQNRLAARALNTNDGTGETLVILGTASNKADAERTVSWTVAPKLSPSLSISLNRAEIGKPVSVRAEGFRAGEEVEFVLRSNPVTVGRATADASGVAQIVFTVPQVDVGSHTLWATGQSSNRTASSPLDVFTIFVRQPELSSTGFEASTLVVLAISAMTVGLLLVTSRRRWS